MTFDERIQKAIAETWSECHYRPTAFIQMVNSYGALESVKRLLTSRQNIPSGLEKLWELGRLDLCFERIIFEPEWHDMFSKDELSEAKKRLKNLNYDVSKLTVEPLNIRAQTNNTVTNWILPCNEDNYDIEKAYREYHTIDWHQTNKKIKIDDIVYIYKTVPYQIVRFKCLVTAVNKRSANRKDVDCYKDSSPFENKDCYMTLKFLYRIEDAHPTMKGLKDAGITFVRQITELTEAARNYIEDCEKQDRSIQRFDGQIPSDIPANHWSIVGGDEEELREKEENEAKTLSDSELFEKAKMHENTNPKGKITTTSSYIRNTYIAEASKRRANGICQLCGQPAPFNDKNGNPYLESHHIIWLSAGGADTLDNTAALCPNCHKKMHIVNDINDVKKLQDLNK